MVRVSPDRAFRALVADKDIVLVGPAASLVGRGQGEHIDSFDLVARINLDCPVAPEMAADRGTRTDLLYHVLFDERHANAIGRDHSRAEVKSWQDAGVKFLVTRQDANHGRVRRIKPFLGDLPLVHIPQVVKVRARRATKTIPNTGVLAIAHLLSLPIRSLHVTGFDFYTSPYFPGMAGFSDEQAARGLFAYGSWGQSPYENQPHKQQPQMVYLADLYRKDKRLTFDDVAKARLGLVDDGPTVVALVPIKQNSVRVPAKNVRTLAGKPLLFWTLKTLHEARRVSQVVVDTDSEEIARLVKKHHPQTQILMRPEHLLGDDVTGNHLTNWEMSQLEGEHFLQTHVTNPLLTPFTVDRAVQAYFEGIDRYDSLFGVTEHHFRLFDKRGEPVNHDPTRLIKSQDLEPLYEDNSNIYLFSRESFQANGGRIGKAPQMFPIGKLEAIDIDYEDDFFLAEAVMRLRNA